MSNDNPELLSPDEIEAIRNMRVSALKPSDVDALFRHIDALDRQPASVVTAMLDGLRDRRDANLKEWERLQTERADTCDMLIAREKWLESRDILNELERIAESADKVPVLCEMCERIITHNFDGDAPASPVGDSTAPPGEERQPHRVMTWEEYKILNIQGWHEVIQHYDGADNVGIRYLGLAPPVSAPTEQKYDFRAGSPSLTEQPGFFRDLKEGWSSAPTQSDVDEAWKFWWRGPKTAETELGNDVLRQTYAAFGAGWKAASVNAANPPLPSLSGDAVRARAELLADKIEPFVNYIFRIRGSWKQTVINLITAEFTAQPDVPVEGEEAK